MAPSRSLCAAMSLLLMGGLAGPAEPTEPRCSLAWPRVLESFGPTSGWRLTEPPILFSLGDDSHPQYQAHVFTSSPSAPDVRMALVIAEWGDPASQDLGPIVYCAIRDGGGAPVEEVGTNPLTARATSWPCQQCA